MASFNSVTINFQTSPHLPPPYAYTYTLVLTVADQRLQASLLLTYLRRDELDNDEIEAEGFTENDDYQWQGTLDQSWIETLEKILHKTQWNATQEEIEEEKDIFGVELNKQAGTPNNLADWQYLAQELVQAVFETSGKERPLELQIIQYGPSSKVEATLIASFQNQIAQIKHNKDGKATTKYFNWNELPHLLEALYAPDWLSDQAKPDKPKKQGLFINLGDGLWHEWGKDIVEVGKKTQTLPNLMAFINKLLA